LLHAPITDSKQQAGSTKADPSARERDWSPAFDAPYVLGLPQIASGGLHPPKPPTPRQQRLAHLQRVYGNQAVLRMLERSQPAIQPKLVVNEPGDACEQEADRVADQVMRMPELELSTAAAPPQLSRKCAACEEEEARALQTKAAGSPEAVAGEAPSIVHDVLRSPGRPLDAAARIFMEDRFRHDFTGVRVHNDAGAASSARAINARAYTLGNDVVFGAGQYSPDSGDGRRLLAHELAHVVQQSGATAKKSTISEARDPYQQPEPKAVDDNASGRTTDSDSTHTAPIDRTPATQAALLEVNKYSGHSGAVLFRKNGESVHPEEQHCDDLSKDPTATCEGIILCLNELIEALAGRFDQFEGDPGHLQRIKIVQQILKTLMVLAASTCKNGEFDKETEEEAQKWADRLPVQRKGPATDEQKKTLRERLPSVPRWVWAVVGGVAAALIIACFATGVCEAGAILAAVGEVIGAIIVGAMRLAGIGLIAQNEAEAPPSSNNGGASAVA
jgi:Domain of unknown function (DUF4157)